MITLNPVIKKHLHEGTVIPAHPLALTADRKLDEARQRLLTRYYLASGAGGIAIGVHTTQFQIRDPKIGLYRKVLELAIEEIDKANLDRPFIKVAGVSGNTEQAVDEAKICAELGYDIVLVSTNGLGDWSEEALLERTRKIAQVVPVFGFYLQPVVGGRVLSFDFWKAFAEIKNVHAIKMAPFNRYQTLEVVRAVCESSRRDEIALYTGNDDNIVNDLLTTYKFDVDKKPVSKDIVGGLLGHWAVWTNKAVELLEAVKKAKKSGNAIPKELLTLNVAVTDSNAAFFDAANNFHGCIAGIHEVLYRQGILKGIWCLDEKEGLSPGQKEEIDRVYQDYPDLNDDIFVEDNIGKWMKGS
ncbi:dihydrodipicolinate synthase family protein [Flavobacteriaceae bacterium F89]|uniref:Dihydrodipicolinate synthase family protein n=1 Tax=Cerina litoralis TaxID=2874477 RepID=A0AAE3EYL1_9FLAO|nr:dihydrodipicolinate synthase family protein [Cerina litoralis]MCG2462097.1 dihydrodipicolinate synthase family protein [Cerina litoralis]